MKKDNYFKGEEYSKIDFIIVIILSVIILDLQLFGIFGRTTFQQDMANVFEGGYRIMNNQVPYRDFFIPMGPVVFYMQAFFNFIFGNNVLSMAMHSFFLSLILCIIFYFLLRREFNTILSFVFAFFFYLSFSGMTFHPLYNYTPYFFFFFIVFMLLDYLKKDSIHKSIYFISALFSSIAFYSKQDSGLLMIFLLFIYFLFNYKRDWKRIILFYFIPVIIFVIGGYFLLSTIPNFSYWFNLGQPPHDSRLTNFLEPTKILWIIESWKFYLTIGLLFIVLFKKNKSSEITKLTTLFLLISIVTMVNFITSGSTRQLSVMGIPVLIFLLYLIVKEPLKEVIKKYRLSTFLIIFLILLLSLNPFPTYGLITLNYFDKNIGRVSEGCYKGYPMPSEVLTGLNEIRKTIEENNKSFVSISEYSFLYCDYKVIPPKGVPNFYSEGVSFFEENIPSILDNLLLNKPQVILLQDAHGHKDKDLNNKLKEFFISKGYSEKKVVPGLSTAPISILVKNESST